MNVHFKKNFKNCCSVLWSHPGIHIIIRNLRTPKSTLLLIFPPPSLGRSSASPSCTDPVTSLPSHAADTRRQRGLVEGQLLPFEKLNGTFLSCLRHLFHQHPPPSPGFPLSLASGGMAALPQDNLTQAALLHLLLLLLSPPGRALCRLHVWNKPGCVCRSQASSQQQQQKPCS